MNSRSESNILTRLIFTRRQGKWKSSMKVTEWPQYTSSQVNIWNECYCC